VRGHLGTRIVQIIVALRLVDLLIAPFPAENET
jgi:hypothetical protein